MSTSNRRVSDFKVLATVGLLFITATASCAGRDATTEADLIAEALSLEPGMRVADVGAGDGEWSEILAAQVGESGHVFATEVTEDNLEEIRERVEDAQLNNVTVIQGDDLETGLPEDCCDAILLRRVYHHFTQPAEIRADLRRALRPGGRLTIIEITPQDDWRVLPDVPERDGHGISPEDLTQEMTSDGLFEVDQTYDRWDEDDDNYCVVFR